MTKRCSVEASSWGAGTRRDWREGTHRQTQNRECYQVFLNVTRCGVISNSIVKHLTNCVSNSFSVFHFPHLDTDRGGGALPPYSACFLGRGGGGGVGGGQTGSQASDRLRKTKGSEAGWRESQTGKGGSVVGWRCAGVGNVQTAEQWPTG